MKIFSFLLSLSETIWDCAELTGTGEKWAACPHRKLSVELYDGVLALKKRNFFNDVSAELKKVNGTFYMLCGYLTFDYMDNNKKIEYESIKFPSIKILFTQKQ
jgi:hypothetical protein